MDPDAAPEPDPDQPADPFAALSVEEPVSTVHRVVEELRRAVFEGELEPGTPLREVGLADGLGVSRPTVREALGQLIAEGIAVRVPNRGTTVRSLSVADVRDVGRARLTLELAGVERWPEADDAARQAVRDAFAAYERVVRSRPTAADLTAAHLDLHRALVGLTGSPRLVALSEHLYAEIRLALASVDRVRGHLDDQVHSHARLLELLEAGDVEAARDELRHHLEGADRSMIEALGLADDEPDDQTDDQTDDQPGD